MEKSYVDITFFRQRRVKVAQSEVEVCSLRFFVGKGICEQIRKIVIAYSRLHKMPLRKEQSVVDFIEIQRYLSLRRSIAQFVRSCFQKALDREIACSLFEPDAQTYTNMEVSELSTLYVHGLHSMTSISVDVPTNPPSSLCYRTSFPIRPATFLRVNA